MARRNIVRDDDPQLRKKSRNVEVFDAKLGKLLDDMYETMVANDGVGLAAPQVGLLRNIFVMDDGEMFIEAINPVILQSSGEQIDYEGCLSVPNKNMRVRRPQNLTVEFYNRDGQLEHMELSGFTARVFCHEYDHLFGTLFYDRALKEDNEEKGGR